MKNEYIPAEIYTECQEIERSINWSREPYQTTFNRFGLLKLDDGYTFDSYKAFENRYSWRKGYWRKFPYVRNNNKLLAPPKPSSIFEYIRWRLKIYRKEIFKDYSDGMTITEIIDPMIIPAYKRYANHIKTVFTVKGLWQYVIFNRCLYDARSYHRDYEILLTCEDAF